MQHNGNCGVYTEKDQKACRAQPSSISPRWDGNDSRRTQQPRRLSSSARGSGRTWRETSWLRRSAALEQVTQTDWIISILGDFPGHTINGWYVVVLAAVLLGAGDQRLSEIPLNQPKTEKLHMRRWGKLQPWPVSYPNILTHIRKLCFIEAMLCFENKDAHQLLLPLENTV